jgi:predicted membrane-bound mannosyltransferase
VRPLAILTLLCVMGLAAFLRLPRLGERPMHADEAVQAYIFADLLEHGKYRYDPAHYHGPLPHFINLPLMRALGVRELGALQPWQFRLQPALAGLLLVALAALCARRGGGRAGGSGILPLAPAAGLAAPATAGGPASASSASAAPHAIASSSSLSPAGPAGPAVSAAGLAGDGRWTMDDGRNPIGSASPAAPAADPAASADGLAPAAGPVAPPADGPHAVAAGPAPAALPASAAAGLPASGLCAALLAAGSPLLVYFSRMAVHETLLACLALAVPLLAARFLETRRAGWLLAAGAALGGLHATKETWSIIAFSWAAAAVALAPRKTWRLLRETAAARMAPAAAAVALAVSFLLYSNLGRHPRAFADAWLTLFHYKTGGGHDKPWPYYLADILTFRAAGHGWHGEGVLLIFAALGAALAAAALLERRRRLRRRTPPRPAPAQSIDAAKPAGIRFGGPAGPPGGGAAAVPAANTPPMSAAPAFTLPASATPAFIPPMSAVPALPLFLALSSLVQIAVYSTIAYKTPWLMLVPVAGLAPLAGHGLAWLIARRPPAPSAAPLRGTAAARIAAQPAARAAAIHAAARRAAGIAAGLLLLLFGAAPQLRDATRDRATDPALPLVYAPTLPAADAALRAAVAALKPGELAAVIGADYWPIPWYFRARRDDTGYYEEFEAPADLSPFALVVRCGYAPPPAAAPGDPLVELRPGYHARISRR